MRLPALVAAAVCATVSVANTRTAHAQPASVGGFALNQLEPAPAGDALFGVPSPWVGGHLVPRAMVMFDYAHEPLRVLSGDTVIISAQGFLRLDASLALWDRLLVSIDVPAAVLQSGEDPGLPGLDFHVPSSAELGDVRAGLRGRLFGDYRDPFQLGVGGYLFLPTAPADSYAGEGAVRGAFHALLGGRAGSSVGFVWSATAGVMLRASDNPSAFTFGGGAALTLGGDLFQIGPEVYGSTPFDGSPLSVEGVTAESGGSTNLEVLLGAKLRVLGGVVAGVAGGPGLAEAVGTPSFRAIGMVGWSPVPDKSAPPPPKKAAAALSDKDGDGVLDDKDACPRESGEISADPARDGCPPLDRDKDEILDVEDACPAFPGLRSGDATKHGCPKDSDEDGLHDGIDACPQVKGPSNSNPKKSGCPKDSDEDGVPDTADACPAVKGPASTDQRRNGCPEDPDGDGVKYPDDACPNEKGAADRDPKQNGCPKLVRVTDTEILIKTQVQFRTYGKSKGETVAPVSEALMGEIRDVLTQHPDILKIEVQGHSDDSGEPEFNLQLSQERADAVRQWLVDAGIPAAKLVAKGYGHTIPAADNRIRDGRQKNRRVQFIILERKK